MTLAINNVRAVFPALADDQMIACCSPKGHQRQIVRHSAGIRITPTLPSMAIVVP
jgi:hypothetical protein